MPRIDPEQAALRFAESCTRHWLQLERLLQPLRLGMPANESDAERTALFRTVLALSEYAVTGLKPRQSVRVLLATLGPLASTPLLEEDAAALAASTDPQVETDSTRMLMSAAVAREQIAAGELVSSTQLAILAGVSRTGLIAAIGRNELAHENDASLGGAYTIRAKEAARWLAQRGVCGFASPKAVAAPVAPPRGRPTSRPRVPHLHPRSEALRIADRAFAQWLSIAALVHPAYSIQEDDVRKTEVYQQLLHLANYAIHGKKLRSTVDAWFATLGPLHTNLFLRPRELAQIVGAVDPLEPNEAKLLLAAAYAREQIDAGKPVTTSQVAILAGISRTGLRAAIERGELQPGEPSPGTGNAYTISAAHATAWLAGRGIPGFTERPRKGRRDRERLAR